MILFIFEGKKEEPRLYKTLNKVFNFKLNEEEILYYYCNNIFSLYNTIKSYCNENAEDISSVFKDIDIINVFKEDAIQHKKDTSVFDKIKYAKDISEIFLFFDFDINKVDDKNKLTVEEQIDRVVELMNFFNNSKIEVDRCGVSFYINYPMIESYKYFKTPLPDDNYKDYVVDVLIDGQFKKAASNFCDYKNTKFIFYDLNNSGKLKIPEDKKREEMIKQNWLYIKEMNIKKANFITTDEYSIPDTKNNIRQDIILQKQIEKYIKPNNEIAILNAFPLFWFEYIDEQKLQQLSRA